MTGSKQEVGIMRFTLRMTAVVPAIAVAATFAASPARAQATTIDSLMTIMGLKSSESGPEIEYRERAPLVVPPKIQLRPPEEPAAKRNAAWPNDPDVQRRKAREAEARIPKTEQDSYKLNQNSRLSIDEIRAGRREGANVNTTPRQVYGDNSREEHWLNPNQLRALDRKTEPDKVVAAGVEPDRRYLTDPPSGYRKPSANAPLAAPRGAITVKQTDNEEASPYEMWKKRSTDD
jgi:hypothetical protein